MTAGKKSLTEAPINLKEAIDWVLRVSGRDSDKENEEGKKAIKGLAEELTASIRKKPYEENDDVKKILTEIMYDANISPTGPVIRLAYALQKFIGYEWAKGNPNYKWKIGENGILKTGDLPNAYTSDYRGSKLSEVLSTVEDVHKKALESFFTAIAFIYEGLTELYFKCNTEWSKQSLSGSGHSDTLNQFMTTNGFGKTQLNSNMTGANIADNALKDLSELSSAYSAAGDNPSLETFRSQLEQNASTDPSKSPLAALYILATYVYVQSTSPATPSFAGYSGLAALGGGAYGLNLGGLGNFVSALLA